MPKKNRNDDCIECNIYTETCNGINLYEAKGYYGYCDNKVTTPPNTFNSLQVFAFHSLYRVKIATGMDSLCAFAEATVQTSDTIWRKIKVKNKHLIEQYKKYGRIK